MGHQRRWTIALAAAGLFVAACTSNPTSTGDRPTAEPSTVGPTTTGPTSEAARAPAIAPSATTSTTSGQSVIATTSGAGTGNPVVAGTADLSTAPISVELGEPAVWVVGAAAFEGVVWVAVTGDGEVTSLLESGGAVAPHPIDVMRLPPGMPPTLVATGDDVALVDPAAVSPEPAPFAGHVTVDGTTAIVTSEGALQVGDRTVAGVVALPDTRIVVSGGGQLALLTDPTDRFRHAVVGDAIEAETVTVVDPATGEAGAVLDAPGDTVFEAISPLWADVDGDGAEEILVTASDATNGARLTVFRPDGSFVAESAPIGRGNRWLNQLGVAGLGPGGELEVVEVKTPHIGGIVQWYRLEGDELVRKASIGGFSTHEIFSRNLDEGLVVDADGDGRLDVVVPSQDNRRLVALSRTNDGAEVVVEVDLAAAPSSNVTAVTRPDGTASVALASQDGRLLIWP